MTSWRPVELASSIHASPRVPLVTRAPTMSSSAFASAVSAQASKTTTTVAEAKAPAQATLTGGNDSAGQFASSPKGPSTDPSATLETTRICLEQLVAKIASIADKEVAASFWTHLILLVSRNSDEEKLGLLPSSNMNDVGLEPGSLADFQQQNVDLMHRVLLEYERRVALEASDGKTIATTAALQSQVARLTLEKGLHKNEVYNVKAELALETALKVKQRQAHDDLVFKLIQHEKSHNAISTEKILLSQALQGTQEKLELSEKATHRLNQDIISLRRSLRLAEESAKAAKDSENMAKERLGKEVRAMADALSNEQQKSTSLNIAAEALKSSSSATSIQADKLQQDLKIIGDRYKLLADQHAQNLTKFTEQSKKMDTLVAELERGTAENANLKQRLAKILELEKLNTELVENNLQLTTQVETIQAELSAAELDFKKTRSGIRVVNDKLEKLQAELTNLKSNNTQLLANQAKMDQVMQEVHTLKAENLKLKSVIDEMNTKPTVSGVGTSNPSEDKMVLQKTIQELQKNKAGLEKSVRRWEELATTSYKEYKAMLPTYKQAEQYRKGCLEKDDAIKALKEDLAVAKQGEAENTENLAASIYWQNRYEGLLDKCST